MYESVSNKIDFTQIETEILAYWKENDIFRKSLAQPNPEHVFYDGPPFPTGSPHHGTIFVSVLKDCVARFFTMAGYTIHRRWGWDCHGLPIEKAVEKKLGLKSKSEIETKIGVTRFNEECRKYVSVANDNWEHYIEKLGRWTEYKNAYRTMDNDFMESVLWVFKQCYDKDYIYKDYRVTPYCYHCETSLSLSDTRESDSTRLRLDPSVVVKFKAKENISNKPAFFLAWTTTPWTLTSNLALAVNIDFDYAAVEKGDMVYILAKALIKEYFEENGSQPKIISEFRGKELVGREYAPVFDYFLEPGTDHCFRILEGDFVSLDEGTGIVHLAPAFGEDDYWLCKRHGIPVRNPVDPSGCFSEEVTDFSGRNVHEANNDIVALLKQQEKILWHNTIEHNYPHCWRCREPLIYRATDAWYFAVEKLKDKLIEHNKSINWIPEHVKHGRFGKWLAGARDWNISRNRYWGTPIPIWDCKDERCGERRVLGSIEEIDKLSGIRPDGLHKEILDTIKIKCPACSGTMERVPEVLDNWFDSGSMPYGQCHYPFENRDWFAEHFPSDFIIEYPGQLRGWFYYLHVLGVALFNRPAFKNCLVHGTLLADDGTKMSKSKMNYTDPMTLIEKYGADAMRIYLLGSPAVSMADLRFEDSGIKDCVKVVMLPLWNAVLFFTTYANIDNYQGNPNHLPLSENPLDNWILAKLQKTEKEVYDSFLTYNLNKTQNPVLDVLECLTNWYIRRSRDRFWQDGTREDKQNAYHTLYYVLVNLVKMLAPLAPFIAEKIYRLLTNEPSVHLAPWPQIPESFENENLVEEIEYVRLITSLGLSLRQKAGIKVRQPLKSLHIAFPKAVPVTKISNQFEVIKDELNVKKILLSDDPDKYAVLRAVPNARVLGPKFGKEMQKIIKAAREGNIREQDDRVIVFQDQERWEIAKEHINIGYEGKEGIDVASDRGFLVFLDTEVTPELREEGIANDLNRIIQDLRKSAEYQISDRIQLHIEGELSSTWLTYLLQSSLAERKTLSSAQADLEKQLTIDNRKFIIRIKK